MVKQLLSGSKPFFVTFWNFMRLNSQFTRNFVPIFYRWLPDHNYVSNRIFGYQFMKAGETTNEIAQDWSFLGFYKLPGDYSFFAVTVDFYIVYVILSAVTCGEIQALRNEFSTVGG